MEFRRSSFNFVSSKEPGQSTSQTISFSREVLSVAVGMIGYSASFDGNDHHLGRFTVELNANIVNGDDTAVKVSGGFALRDWSGEFDDNYSGNIQWVVIAELAPLPPTAPGSFRGDLTVIDAEISQVIQHFRSSEHLDAANVFPDNSIRLVANKPTFIRLYTDYDSTSGLPNISSVSGELEVTSGSMTQMITPVSSIPPIRNNNINRGDLNHTLNFLIPEALCRGTVSFRVKIFDESDDTQFSANFNKSISFESFPSLPIHAVGVKYTGEDVDDGATSSELSAPTLNDFIDVFEFTEKVYPIPQVFITNYSTVEYDKEIESDISSGGCDKFGDLLDTIEDFKGDSDDIVYGMVNSGVNTGSVGGCGRSGVVAGRIGSQGTAAHEIGHGLGREHAPCDNVTRCAEPANADGNYPNYSGYDSDSIGEYGIDVSNSSIKSPGNVHDFMGYSGNRWISPYTYKALMSKIPSTFASAGASAALTAGYSSRRIINVNDREWIPIKTPHLFVRIDIDSKRNVKFHKSFCFNSYPRQHGTDKSNFSLAFLDGNENLISSTCLYTDSGCSCCGCNEIKFPVIIRQAVSFPKNAKKVIIYECEKEIHRKEILEKPTVRIKCKGVGEEGDERIMLEWSIISDNTDESFLSLVQWRDRLGTWRGVAPRTEKRTMQISKRLFGRQKNIGIRVLVTSGVATGQSLWEGDCQYQSTNKPIDVQVDIQLVGVSGEGNKPIQVSSILKAVPFINGSRTHVLPEISWYNENGAEISRGGSIDLNRLPYGETYVTASVLETGQGFGTNQWLIERTKNNEYRILRGTIDRKKPC